MTFLYVFLFIVAVKLIAHLFNIATSSDDTNSFDDSKINSTEAGDYQAKTAVDVFGNAMTVMQEHGHTFDASQIGCSRL